MNSMLLPLLVLTESSVCDKKVSSALRSFGPIPRLGSWKIRLSLFEISHIDIGFLFINIR